MAKDWQIAGTVADAPFTLKLHRGEGMVLLAMDWRGGPPPRDFIGFAIEFQPPRYDRFFPVKNRLAFPGQGTLLQPGKPPEQYPSPQAPFQTFRWTHFPRVANMAGEFVYRVTPMFMNSEGVLAAGIAQLATIVLSTETLPGSLNVAFTRGYVSSQAFVDKFGGAAGFATLIPPTADEGNDFVPTNPQADAAYDWMGFEARRAILDVLDAAIADQATVEVVAFELNLPEIIHRLATIGARLRIIIDDSGDKGAPGSAESRAATMLAAAGAQIVRQSMASLQHNKMIIVDGATVKRVVFGSTNFSWRGFFVQANNAVIVTGQAIVAQQRDAFESYWTGNAPSFRKSTSADWLPLHVAGADAQVSMSPHASQHRAQPGIAEAIDSAASSVFYSLAFLSQIKGDVRDAIERATNRDDVFVYGISDRATGLMLTQPDGNPAPVSAASLNQGMPEPFRSESSGGAGVRMHHKFVVIDFNTPAARVYTGSYNFSNPADTKNGENLLVIRNEKVATAYMVEALRIFDSYAFRLAIAKAKKVGTRKTLQIPPTDAAAPPWFDKFYSVPVRIRDRKLFA